MKPGLNLIVACCENMGIGLNGDLPWKLKNEMAYFKRMTTNTLDPQKKNAVVMGRKTWESIPAKFRPLPDRINIVLSRTVSDLGKQVLVVNSFEEVFNELRKPDYASLLETIWVIGGQSVYNEAMASDKCSRVYLTHIKKDFNCDTYLPPIPDRFTQVKDDQVPEGLQEENGIFYEYKVYEAK